MQYVAVICLKFRCSKTLTMKNIQQETLQLRMLIINASERLGLPSVSHQTNYTQTDSFTGKISTIRSRSARYVTFSNSYRNSTCRPYEVTAGIAQSVQRLRLGDGQQRNRASIPGRGNIILSPKDPPRSGCISIQSPTEWVPWVMHPGVQRPPPTCAEGRNEWSYTPTPVFFYDLHRNNFIALSVWRQRMIGMVKCFTMLYQDYYQRYSTGKINPLWILL
jgi:hypothetical protein